MAFPGDWEGSFLWIEVLRDIYHLKNIAMTIECTLTILEQKKKKSIEKNAILTVDDMQ